MDASDRFTELLSQLAQRKQEVATAVAEKRRRERAVTQAFLQIAGLMVSAFTAEGNGDHEAARRFRALIDEQTVVRQRLVDERDRHALTVRELRRKMHRFYADLEDAKRTVKTGKYWS